MTQQPWSGLASRHGSVLWDAVRDLLASAGQTRSSAELRVLDLGGGTGGLAVPVAELGPRVTVVDPSPDALAALTRRAVESGVDQRIDGLQGDAADLLDHVDRGEFDVVLCHEVLEVVDSPDQALDAIRETMRPHGVLSVVVAGRYAAVLGRALTGQLSEARSLLEDAAADGASRSRRYVPTELVDLLTAHGFESERVHGVRVFADLVPSTSFDVEPDAAQALLELERAVAGLDEFTAVAAQLHVVARRSTAATDAR